MHRRAITALVAVLVGGVALMAAGCGSNGSKGASAAPTSSARSSSSPPRLALLTPKNCRQLLDLPMTFSDALTGAGNNLRAAVALVKVFSVRSPLEVRADFQFLAVASNKIALALKGVDLDSNKTPSAAEIARVRSLSTRVNTARVTEAASNVSTWAQKNCSGTGSGAFADQGS